MRQTGKVVSTNSENAFVQIVRTSACGGNCKSCGGSCSPMGVQISAPNTIDAKKGDIVNIDSDTSSVLKIAAVFYIIPLLVLVPSIILSKIYLFPEEIGPKSDLMALLIGAVLYVLCLYLIHLFTKKKKYNVYYFTS